MKVDKGTHKEGHLRSSVFITDIVTGMSDGLTVPFALAEGLSCAVQSNAIIITAGIAEIVAGSIAMVMVVPKIARLNRNIFSPN